MGAFLMRLKALTLFFGGHACAQKPKDVFVTLGIDYDNQAPLDRPNCYEPILFVGVLLVVDLQILNAAPEQLSGFLKGQAVLGSIGPVFPGVPYESRHTLTV
jgi:hypothetical protein